MIFFTEDFLGKSDQIHRKPWTWSHLLKKLLMENVIFCAVNRFTSSNRLLEDFAARFWKCVLPFWGIMH